MGTEYDPEIEAGAAWAIRSLDRMTAPIRKLERITELTKLPPALRSVIEQHERLSEAVRPRWMREMQELHEAVRPRWMREMQKLHEAVRPSALRGVRELFDPFRDAPSLRELVEQKKRLRALVMPPVFLQLAPWLDGLGRLAERIARRGPVARAFEAIERNEYMVIVEFTLGVLGLELEHVEHVLAILRAESWRNARDPIAYIRGAARARRHERERRLLVAFEGGERVDGYDIDAHVDGRDLEVSLAWVDFAQLKPDEQNFILLRCEGHELKEIARELGWDAQRLGRVHRALGRRGLSLPVRRRR